MRILITGERGYIGRYLLRNGIGLNGTEIVLFSEKTDLLDFPKVNSELKSLKPDIIIHCAGASSVINSLNNPYSDFEKNVLTTRNLLEAIRLNCSYTHFIYLSSAAVYGNPKKMPIVESVELNPISPYGFSKVCSETLIQQYINIYGFKCTVLRIFSIYGDGIEKQVVYDIFNKFFDSKNQQVELFGTGSEERDFIHIEDFKQIIKMIIQEKVTGTYNVASGQSVKIRDLTEIIKRIIGSEKNVGFKGENRKGDPVKWQVDIDKIKDLGFQPSISLEEGINMYYEWYRKSRCF